MHPGPDQVGHLRGGAVASGGGGAVALGGGGGLVPRGPGQLWGPGPSWILLLLLLLLLIGSQWEIQDFDKGGGPPKKNLTSLRSA